MQLPCVEVSQLASSTSFYAAVLQPLGLRYLLSESVASGPDFATFGCCRGPVLHLRQIARPTALRLSMIRISAPTPASIQAFYRQGLEAAPASMFAADDSVNHSTIFDLDGNRMQAVYTGHVCRPDVTTGQYAMILDPQQDTHVFQVLDWNNCKPEHCGVKNIDDGGRTTETLDTQGSREATDSFQTKTEDNNTPIGGMPTVLGALLGVAAGAAAGAAITYGVMSAKKPELVPTEIDRRQRSLPNNAQAPSTSGTPIGTVDRDQHKPVPVRSQRIKFHEDQTVRPPVSTCPAASIYSPASVRPPASARPPASVRPLASADERTFAPSHNANNECGDEEEQGRELIKIFKDVELSPMKSSSRVLASAPSRTVPRSRRLALPSPADAASGVGTNGSEGQSSVKEPETYSTAHSRVSLSFTNPAQALKGSSEFTTLASSLTPKREQSNNQDHQQSGSDAKSSISKVSSISRLKEPSSPKPRSTLQPTEVSQRSSRTAPHRSGATEYFDSRSHVSARQTNVSASRNHSGEDSRSHISAKDASLPLSRVGSSDFYDTQSHFTARKTDVSARRHHSSEAKRSYVSAKDVPLPPSRVGNSELFDTQSQISTKKSDASAGHHHNMEDKRSRVSARDIPLPSSRVGTSEFFDTVSHVSARKASSSASRKNTGGAEDLRSHVSAKNIALPASCVNGVSKVTGHSSRVSARNIPLPASCIGSNDRDGSQSRVSARHVPLPGSHVGNSRTNWEDDFKSIAPSDSISCVGSK